MRKALGGLKRKFTRKAAEEKASARLFEESRDKSSIF
jgi:hypothetical protein